MPKITHPQHATDAANTSQQTELPHTAPQPPHYSTPGLEVPSTPTHAHAQQQPAQPAQPPDSDAPAPPQPPCPPDPAPPSSAALSGAHAPHASQQRLQYPHRPYPPAAAVATAPHHPDACRCFSPQQQRRASVLYRPCLQRTQPARRKTPASGNVMPWLDRVRPQNFANNRKSVV